MIPVVVKVRLQVSPELYKNSILRCSASILKNEGFLNFWRGITPTLGGMVFINGIVFGVEGHMMKKLGNAKFSTDNHNNELAKHFFAGSVAGAVQSLIACPSELLKCRMQMQELGNSSVKYKNIIDACKQISKAEGFKAIFNGMMMTLLREIPSYGVYFSSFHWMHTHPNKYIDNVRKKQDSCVIRFLSHISCTLYIGFNTPETPEEMISTDMLKLMNAGGIAGSLCWAVSYPADVVKTRLQVDGFSGERKYSGSLDCFRKSIRNDGVSCLYRGLGPTILRAFPVNAVTFAVTLITLEYIQKIV